MRGRAPRLVQRLLRSISQPLRASVARLARGASSRWLTVSEGWERYARSHHDQHSVGDEWNRPERIGIDVGPDEVVPTLDAKVFEPFLEPCDTILEIGCGGGRWTTILLPKAKRVIAADTSPTMLKHCRSRIGDDPRLETLLLDGRGLTGVPDGSVDAVFSYGVFVHLHQWDIYNYLREAARVLKPGGRFALHHSNTTSELGWELFEREVEPSIGRSKPFTTFTVMTPELMRRFAEEAGLEVVEQRTDIVRRDCITLMRLPNA